MLRPPQHQQRPALHQAVGNLTAVLQEPIVATASPQLQQLNQQLQPRLSSASGSSASGSAQQSATLAIGPPGRDPPGRHQHPYQEVSLADGGGRDSSADAAFWAEAVRHIEEGVDMKLREALQEILSFASRCTDNLAQNLREERQSRESSFSEELRQMLEAQKATTVEVAQRTAAQSLVIFEEAANSTATAATQLEAELAQVRSCGSDARELAREVAQREANGYREEMAELFSSYKREHVESVQAIMGPLQEEVSKQQELLQAQLAKAVQAAQDVLLNAVAEEREARQKEIQQLREDFAAEIEIRSGWQKEHAKNAAMLQQLEASTVRTGADVAALGRGMGQLDVRIDRLAGSLTNVQVECTKAKELSELVADQLRGNMRTKRSESTVTSAPADEPPTELGGSSSPEGVGLCDIVEASKPSPADVAASENGKSASSTADIVATAFEEQKTVAAEEAAAPTRAGGAPPPMLELSGIDEQQQPLTPAGDAETLPSMVATQRTLTPDGARLEAVLEAPSPEDSLPGRLVGSPRLGSKSDIPLVPLDSPETPSFFQTSAAPSAFAGGGDGINDAVPTFTEQRQSAMTVTLQDRVPIAAAAGLAEAEARYESEPVAVITPLPRQGLLAAQSARTVSTTRSLSPILRQLPGRGLNNALVANAANSAPSQPLLPKASLLPTAGDALNNSNKAASCSSTASASAGQPAAPLGGGTSVPQSQVAVGGAVRLASTGQQLLQPFGSSVSQPSRSSQEARVFCSSLPNPWAAAAAQVPGAAAQFAGQQQLQFATAQSQSNLTGGPFLMHNSQLTRGGVSPQRAIQRSALSSSPIRTAVTTATPQSHGQAAPQPSLQRVPEWASSVQYREGRIASPRRDAALREAVGVSREPVAVQRSVSPTPPSLGPAAAAAAAEAAALAGVRRIG
eukprot:TRINITY_DN47622_c0_g1_i2.p1 TRINITY_DN47622_c0_g1~~TRINITY_DN47622_c0_g1_i2.p1  ORF type:complete len:914 (-),score=232.77 TRINITY_DN47622_c0_g1_i2:37-2778(-)